MCLFSTRPCRSKTLASEKVTSVRKAELDIPVEAFWRFTSSNIQQYRPAGRWGRSLNVPLGINMEEHLRDLFLILAACTNTQQNKQANLDLIFGSVLLKFSSASRLMPPSDRK